MTDLAVLKALHDLARRLETLENSSPDGIEKQLKRLAKEQYKANALTEAQTGQTQETIQSLQAALETVRAEQQAAVTRARRDLVKTLLPVLDSIEAGLRSGAQQVKALQTTAPAAVQPLVAWLNGQRLLRERMLKILEAEGVEPIPTLNQPFDPYRHAAVKTVSRPDQPDGIVVAVERPGYMAGETVLRYAEVIVNKQSGG